VILLTKLTSLVPSKKRQTVTMRLRRTCSQSSVDDIVETMVQKGWETAFAPVIPSLPPRRQCASCGCCKPRRSFSRHQCRSTTPSCRCCTLGQRVEAIVNTKKRRRQVADDLLRAFVPPSARPPAVVPPSLRSARVEPEPGSAGDPKLLPSFLVAPVDTTERRVPVYTDHQGIRHREIRGYILPGQTVTQFRLALYEGGRKAPWACIRVSSLDSPGLWISERNEETQVGQLRRMVDAAPICAWSFIQPEPQLARDSRLVSSFLVAPGDTNVTRVPVYTGHAGTRERKVKGYVLAGQTVTQFMLVGGYKSKSSGKPWVCIRVSGPDSPGLWISTHNEETQARQLRRVMDAAPQCGWSLLTGEDGVVLRPVSVYAEGSLPTLPTESMAAAEQTEEELATEQRQIRWRKRVAEVGIFG